MHDGPFGDPAAWPDQDLVAVSEHFDAALTLEAYASGVFPMPVERDLMGWWSPMDRAVIPEGRLRVRRSLRKTARRYTTTADAAFADVIGRCADPAREGAWIDARIVEVYVALHHAGLAHSIEVWDDEGRLVGGLYGLHIAGVFAGESMFHDDELGRDASKTALMRLVVELRAVGVVLLDTQWLTPHLESLGAVEMSRQAYLIELRDALTLPMVRWQRRKPMTGGELVGNFRT